MDHYAGLSSSVDISVASYEFSKIQFGEENYKSSLNNFTLINIYKYNFYLQTTKMIYKISKNLIGK